jgi:hypothetical protein
MITVSLLNGEDGSDNAQVVIHNFLQEIVAYVILVTTVQILLLRYHH